MLSKANFDGHKWSSRFFENFQNFTFLQKLLHAITFSRTHRQTRQVVQKKAETFLYAKNYSESKRMVRFFTDRNQRVDCQKYLLALSKQVAPCIGITLEQKALRVIFHRSRSKSRLPEIAAGSFKASRALQRDYSRADSSMIHCSPGKRYLVSASYVIKDTWSQTA